MSARAARGMVGGQAPPAAGGGAARPAVASSAGQQAPEAQLPARGRQAGTGTAAWDGDAGGSFARAFSAGRAAPREAERRVPLAGGGVGGTAARFMQRGDALLARAREGRDINEHCTRVVLVGSLALLSELPCATHQMLWVRLVWAVLVHEVYAMAVCSSGDPFTLFEHAHEFAIPEQPGGEIQGGAKLFELAVDREEARIERCNITCPQPDACVVEDSETSAAALAAYAHFLFLTER